MARKKSGGFSKVLNFIGLVDDGAPNDDYEDEYESGNYGRPSTYIPQRSAARVQQERSRAQQPMQRRGNPTAQPTRPPRMNRNGASSRFDDSRGASRRAADNSARGRYDYSPRASRFDDSSRFDEAPSAPMSVPQTRSARQRTMMFSLHALEDCCEVIDNLIVGNTVILTMEDLDDALMLRAVDTLSGAVFALHATIRKASDRTYLIAPVSVEVNADETFEPARRF